MATVNVITGINGSGKTLRLLPVVEKLRVESGRPVYYFAIPGIKEAGKLPDWIEIEPFDRRENEKGLKQPMKLWELPEGSIIVIDEAHRTFPRRGQNSQVPQHVQPFDMARHSGYEFYLCTQDVKDLDPFIRSRIGHHEHATRVFGLERSTIWRWQGQGDPGSTKSVSLAEKIEFGYPKEVYGWYKSADSHVVKKTPPWKKLISLALFLIAIPVLLWIAYSRITNLDGFSGQVKPGTEGATPAPPPPVDSKVAAQRDAAEWAERFRERIPGAPQSAAFYDDGYKAKAVPRIAGCMRIQIKTVDRCTCNTQQGSTIEGISHQSCVYMVRNGWFDPMTPDESVPRDRQPNPTPPAPTSVLTAAAG